MTKHPHLETESCPWKDSVALYVLGNLIGDDRLALEQHLGIGCSICSSEVGIVAESIAKLVASSSVTRPEESRERFLVQLEKERADKAPPPQARAARLGANEAAIIHQESGVMISRSDAIPWQPLSASGISTKLLFADREHNCITSLVRLEPGVHYPSHRHGGPEEIFLLSGEITIEGKLMKAGDYCHAEPGSMHGESFSSAGCTFILRASMHNKELIEHA